jgi:IS4 transposase
MKTDYIELYTDYLISSNGKATAAGMSEMMDNAISHDQITRFLSKNEFDSKELWLKVKETVREIKSQDACLIEGSVGVLNLVCSDTALDGDSVSTLYEKRWKVEEFYKSLKHNVDLATSPTKTIMSFYLYLSFSNSKCLKSNIKSITLLFVPSY